MRPPVIPIKLDLFTAVYPLKLKEAHTARPDLYAFPAEEVPTVAARMVEAVRRGSYNHEGPAFKATCKALGIPHTRKAIEAFLTVA
jgi:hypothetical protein